MPAPTIDPTKPEALMKELFDDDAWIKNEFAVHLGGALLNLCEALATCFKVMEPLNVAANTAQTVQAALVAAFAFGMLDDLVVSTKLLLTGKYPASGNLMRQVIEGIAMTVLCSANQPLIVKEPPKTKPPVTLLYWQGLDAGDPLTYGHLAINQLTWNAGALGLTDAAIERLRDARDHYNAFSHCGTATISNRVSLNVIGQMHMGGHFDEAKVGAYRAELEGRINLCRVLPSFMQHVLARIMFPAAGPAVPAKPPASP